MTDSRQPNPYAAPLNQEAFPELEATRRRRLPAETAVKALATILAAQGVLFVYGALPIPDDEVIRSTVLLLLAVFGLVGAYGLRNLLPLGRALFGIQVALHTLVNLLVALTRDYTDGLALPALACVLFGALWLPLVRPVFEPHYRDVVIPATQGATRTRRFVYELVGAIGAVAFAGAVFWFFSRG